MSTRTDRIGYLALALLAGCSAVGGGSVGLGFGDGGLGAGDGGINTPSDARPGDGPASRSDTPAGATDAQSPGDGAALDAEQPSDAATAGDGTVVSSDAPAGCTARELCGNGLDDDCNGMVDDNCPCLPGTTQPCYGGDAANAGRGVCSRGVIRCEGSGEFGRWSSCEGWGRPGVEACGNAMDDDCDGMIDEGCLCNPGMLRECYSGSVATRGVGTCRSGMQQCVAREGGAEWSECQNEVLPATDLCDGMDRDCDGNPNTGCTCVAGATRSCYSGNPATANVGLCRAGTETCARDKMTGRTAWGSCAGEVLPATDRCDGMDRDCDGNPNTNCACTLGATRGCYDGPMGTADRGTCRAGTQRCEASGTTVAWSSCAGQTLPATEICGNSLDDNCDGTVDEGCVTCPPPRVMCPAGCVDTRTDRNNCGRCGNVCPSGQACANGVCVGDGMLRITMVWTLAGDMDLHVVPPCGSEISYRATNQCGGQLDRDDTSTTGPENVFWAAAPASGTYLVCATPYSIRGSTPFTVTVNRGATEIRRWTGTRTSSTGYVRCSTSSPHYLGSFNI